MIWLYLRTKSPAGMARVAILWPDGTALAVTTPSPGMVAPAAMAWPATTTLSSRCRRMVVPPMIWFIHLSSWALNAGRINIYGVERRCRRDKQAVPALPAEAHVRDDLRCLDAAQQRAVGRVTLDVGVCAGPHIAVHIDAEAVRDADLDVAENAAIGQPLAVHHIERADVMRRVGIVRGRGIRDIEDL